MVNFSYVDGSDNKWYRLELTHLAELRLLTIGSQVRVLVGSPKSQTETALHRVPFLVCGFRDLTESPVFLTIALNQEK